MPIRNIQEQDYQKLAELYKEFFPTHNIFQQDKDVVISYLRKEASKREAFLVCEEDGEIKGALILVLLGKSADNFHTRWRFRHFAFASDEVGEKLLQEVEKRVKESSKTAKVELNIAENEKGMEFYRNNGYQQEGELKNHFRWEETCFILGKSFS